jgi:hypothetical protein
MLNSTNATEAGTIDQLVGGLFPMSPTGLIIFGYLINTFWSTIITLLCLIPWALGFRNRVYNASSAIEMYGAYTPGYIQSRSGTETLRCI